MGRRKSRDTGTRTGSLWRRLSIFACGMGVIALCVALRAWWGAEQASAQRTPARSNAVQRGAGQNQAARQGATAPTAPKPVATVNGEQIGRQELANECFRYYGKDVLSSLVRKNLVAQFCQQRGITIGQADVKAEIDRMADRFGAPADMFLEMLEKERGITAQQYARDIIWPSLALRRIAAQSITVSSEEVLQAYETQFGPAVQARLIALDDPTVARQIHALAIDKPEDFGQLAMEHSVDAASASAKGRIQPIRRHMGDEGIEQVAFNLQEGAVSEIVQVGNQYVILKCEKHIPQRNVRLEGKIQQILEEAVRDKKLRDVSDDEFKKLSAQSKIDIVYNDPQRRRAHPGVAAVINGQTLSIEQLAAECIARHGKEILAGMISRKIVDQACQKHQVTFADAEVDAEIERAALSMGKITDDGRPDVEAWLKEITEEHEISQDLYILNEVIPSVKLKKLVGGSVKITEEDLRKGYEANWGPLVRCLAIVLDNDRRAQQVWDKVRKHQTPEFFGELAEQYSSDASTRVLRGEIPPLRRHGGQPALEKEAFGLTTEQPLSAIVQVADRFVILYYQGTEQPDEVPPLADVRDNIYREIHEKKLRVAMAREFSRLYESAAITNELAGTSQSPDTKKMLRRSAGTPGLTPPPNTGRRPRAGSRLEGGTNRQ